MSVALVIPAALWKPVGVASQQVVLRGNCKESHPVCLARRASVGATAKKIWHNSSCNQLGLVLDCLLNNKYHTGRSETPGSVEKGVRDLHP